MHKLFKSYLSIALMLVAFNVWAESSVKLGVVNVALLLEQAPQAKTADARLKKEFEPQQAELKGLAGKLEKIQSNYQKNKMVMGEAQKVTKEREITMLTREIQRRRNDIQELLNIRRNEELAKLQNVVNDAIKAIGQKQKFDLILYEGIAYTNERIDVTKDVLSHLKTVSDKKRSEFNKQFEFGILQLKDIVAHLNELNVQVELVGKDDSEIKQVAGLDTAENQNISFLNDKKYLSYLESTRAGAVILSASYSPNCHVAHLIVDDPYYVYALVAQLLNTVTVEYKVHPDSTVDPKATIANCVAIEAQAVVQANATVGEGTLICAGTVIQEGAQLGDDCRIGANVVIGHNCIIGNNVTIEAGTVIGGDGFGWAAHQGKWVKIPQVGRVVIGNNVSIANNVCIDRGAIEDTIIEDDCIIDNLVHIAHNVKIGQGSAIAGQVGFAGSTTLGAHCTIAGQAGFAGHIEITDNSHFFAKAGVTHNIKEPGVYSGFPAIPVSEWQKNSVRARGLDKMSKQLKQLQKQLDALETKLD